jgi:copper chaperone CopZ
MTCGGCEKAVLRCLSKLADSGVELTDIQTSVDDKKLVVSGPELTKEQVLGCLEKVCLRPYSSSLLKLSALHSFVR